MDTSMDISMDVSISISMVSCFAGRHVVNVGDLNIDIFLEVPPKDIVKYCIYWTISLTGFSYSIKSKYSRTSAESLFPNVLA